MRKTLTAVIAAAAITAAATTGCSNLADGQPVKAAVDAPVEPVQEVAPEPVYEPEIKPALPTKKDFDITLKTVSQQCFGSAGCNVEVEPEVGYSGLAPMEDLSCDVTYEISGDESGPVIQTAYGDGEDVEIMTSVLSTVSSSVEPEAKVTSVDCY